MTRTIKASEVKPGMKIQWEVDDSLIQTYAKAVKRVERGARMEITTRTDAFWYIRSDIPVTVLSETLPEEPTTFGARVMAGGLMFVRGIHHERPWMVSLDGELYDWNDLCKLGSVAVIEAEPYWEIPTDVDSDSEVPERIEEWPENDEHLRDYLWLDSEGDTWTWDHIVSRWKCTSPSGKHLISRTNPFCDPWIRITIKEQKEN